MLLPEELSVRDCQRLWSELWDGCTYKARASMPGVRCARGHLAHVRVDRDPNTGSPGSWIKLGL